MNRLLAKISSAVLALLLCYCPLSHAQVAWGFYVGQAWGHFQEGNYSEASELLEKGLSAAPLESRRTREYAEVLGILGASSYRLQKYARAYECHLESVDILLALPSIPLSAVVREAVNLSSSGHQLGRYNEIVERLQVIIAKLRTSLGSDSHPDTFVFWVEQGTAFAKLKVDADAARVFSKARDALTSGKGTLDRPPELIAYFYLEYARVLSRLGKKSDEALIIDQGIRMLSGSATKDIRPLFPLLVRSANLQFSSDQFALAKATLQRAIVAAGGIEDLEQYSQEIDMLILSIGMAPQLLDGQSRAIATQLVTTRLASTSNVPSEILVAASQVLAQLLEHRKFTTYLEAQELFNASENNVRRHSAPSEALIALKFSRATVALAAENLPDAAATFRDVLHGALEADLPAFAMRALINLMEIPKGIELEGPQGVLAQIKNVKSLKSFHSLPEALRQFPEFLEILLMSDGSELRNNPEMSVKRLASFADQAIELFKTEGLWNWINSSTREQSLRRIDQLLSIASIHESLKSLNSSTSKKSRDESFADRISQAIQLGQLVQSGDVLQKTTAALAANSPRKQSLLADFQKVTDELRQLRPTRALTGQSPTTRSVDPKDERLREVIFRGTELSLELKREFPDYFQLMDPAPVSLTSVKEALEHDEAVLMLYAGDGVMAALFVSKTETIYRVQPFLARKDLREKIQQLIKSVNDYPSFQSTGQLEVEINFELFDLLIGPFDEEIRKSKHLILIPSTDLVGVPFSALLTEKPPKASYKLEELQGLAWLIKRIAYSVIPTARAFVTLRASRHVEREVAPVPFLGLGNPRFHNRDLTNRGGRAPVLAARNIEARTQALKHLDALPETEIELRQISKHLGGKESDLYFQENATEAKLKSLDLTQYRVIGFATHGLLAGEIHGVDKAGLVLTPPESPTSIDDGLLTTDEISNLKLRAELVLLSACNTAGPDGSPNAEGLSGLSKSFFHAGAKSLLVTHWPIASEATVQLTTRLMGRFANGTSKADALKLAVGELLSGSIKAEYAHPLFWAPFFLVGEGR